jgi:hypothetical protein
MVWLDSRHLKTNYHKKMAPKQEGPFEIEEVLRPVTYQLKLLESWQIHEVFQAASLQPYRENEVYGENYIRPPPITKASWEPKSNFTGATDILQEYQELHQL